MMTVLESDVRIMDLDIQVVTRPKAGLTRWALCAIEGAERVQFEGVTIEMPNPEGADAAIFDVTLGEDAALARMADAPPGEFKIGLTNCFARGDCRLFRIASVLPGRLQIDQTCVSLGRPVVVIDGISETPKERDRIELELSHSTLICHDSLVRISNESLGGPVEVLPLRVVADNSIMATSAGVPLMRMIGPMASDEFKRLLTWIGSANLYEGFDSAWQIDAEQLGFDIEELTFADWRRFCELSPEAREDGTVATASPWASDRWRTLEPASVQLSDLELDDNSGEGEALGTATDGTDLGAPIAELRKLLDGKRPVVPE